MMRSLYSAISGLKNHQVKMDVIGNNISNVNTTGYKRSRVSFSTMLSQNLKGASAPTANQGGTNTVQVGLGVMLGSIDQIMTQGSSQSTGNATDMMLQGSGFFVLNNNGQQVYTRAGGFGQDSAGTLIDPATGAKVQGYSWGADDTTPVVWGAASDIRFKLGDKLATDSFFPIRESEDGPVPVADLDAANHPEYDFGITNAENLTIDGMTRVPIGSTPAEGQFSYDPSSGILTFASNFDSASSLATIHYIDPAGSGTNNTNITVDSATQITVDYPPQAGANVYLDDLKYTLSTSDTPGNGEYVVKYLNGKYQITLGVNQEDGVTPTDADGAGLISYDFTNKAHTLTDYSIDQSGVITGVYSNGVDSVTHKIAQIAVASFANEAGLANIGGNFFSTSNNSGAASIGAAGEDGRASIVSNTVEMSNVDLSTEFTDMIVTQRGFQANSRVITVSDTLLEELINLKR
ncbi:flagellar hook protein FlgE [Desulfosporosinus meridiei]|uniref:Flagellar hook protein FlgE n=1 Tax=Desulfosporosinus meridiei (strain ATCC BAA-275 / DSM 13257 / KCTC 12902 / NCIMB 13706 / S10) TaxID=768704 RepID=J7IV70_DESMD|nr:flagellar hook protein FlgE [Desulfosporosinus meridiei]AFQ45727.1 flagellar hook-basal body protein [Desulfosporosinus meridiei DSM 13257]